MDEKTLLAIMQMFGDKLYELQIGFTTMFNMCVRSGSFTEQSFHQEKEKLEALPEFRELREALDGLSKSKVQADFESFLRAYKGTVQ
jgi:hypothetical protein